MKHTTFDNTQHLQKAVIHAPVEVRIHNPSKRAAADPRLRPRGHRNQLSADLCYTFLVS